VSFLGVLARGRRLGGILGTAFAVLGAIVALFVADYTGVLLHEPAQVQVELLTPCTARTRWG
jgi:hypothetical protein